MWQRQAVALLVFALCAAASDVEVAIPRHPNDCLADVLCFDIDAASYCHQYSCACFAGYEEKNEYCHEIDFNQQNCSEHFSTCPPKVALVELGNEIVIGCKAARMLSTCKWKNPKGEDVYPELIDDHYEKVDLGKFYCNLKIVNARDEDHGNWTCTPTINGEDKPIEANSTFVLVATPPPAPVIFYESEKGIDTINVEEGHTATLSCHVRASRPSANISWSIFPDDESTAKDLTKEAKQRSVRLKDAGPDMETTVSFLSIKPDYKLNGHTVSCDVSHIALTEDMPHKTSTKLNVAFRPVFLNPRHHDYSFDRNSKAEIVYRFLSNPPPASDRDIKLVIDKRVAITSGSSSSDGVISIGKLWKVQNKSDEYAVKVTFNKLTMEETKSSYSLFVTNRMGKPESFHVLVKLNPSGEEDNHAGKTAGIIIGFLIIIIGAFLTYFAWLRSKWCFKPNQHESLLPNEASIRSGPELFYK